jgi:predicted AlkP superfamily phosphohydrolase/phosphomutase
VPGKTLVRFVGGSVLSAVALGALYSLVLWTGSDFPRPLPDALVLALWFCAFLAAPAVCWGLMRALVRLAVRRPAPGWGESLREGAVIAGVCLGLSILLFDLAVGESLFAIERARSGLRWMLEDLAAVIGLGLAAGFAARWLPRMSDRSALRTVALAIAGLFAINGFAAAAALASRPPAPRLEPQPAAENPKRLILIGLDGLSWKVLEPMLSTAQMPALARALGQGSQAVLESEPNAQSPVAWTTLHTGRPPSEHHITGYVVTDFPGASVQVKTTLGRSGRWLYPFYAMAALFQVTGLGNAVPPTSAYRRADALWDLVSAMGGSANVINCWATWPAYPIRGAIVSDAFFGDWMWAKAHRQVNEQAVFPSTLRPTVEAWVTAPDAFESSALADWAAFDEADWAHLRASVRSDGALGQPLTHLKWAAAIQDNVFRVAGKLLEPPQANLTVLEVAMPDEVNHFFARYRFPEGLTSVAPEQARKLGPIVDASYRRLDALLAPLLERADAQTAVVIVSDHGFQVLDEGPISDAAHDAFGVLIALGGPFKAGGPRGRASIYDVVPTLLKVLDYPVPADLRGRVLDELMEKQNGREPTGPRPF